MNKTHRLPKHISHVIAWYIIATITGSSFMTACNNSSHGMDPEPVVGPKQQEAEQTDVTCSIDVMSTQQVDAQQAVQIIEQTEEVQTTVPPLPPKVQKKQDIPKEILQAGDSRCE